MTLRKIFPFASTGGGGALTITGFLPSDPAQKYNPAASGSSNQNVSAVVTGGVPPYTYLWTYVSGSTAVYNSATTSNPTTFSAIGNGVFPNTKTAVWNVEVTDSVATQVDDDMTMEFIFGQEPP